MRTLLVSYILETEIITVEQIKPALYLYHKGYIKELSMKAASEYLTDLEKKGKNLEIKQQTKKPFFSSCAQEEKNLGFNLKEVKRNKIDGPQICSSPTTFYRIKEEINNYNSVFSSFWTDKELIIYDESEVSTQENEEKTLQEGKKETEIGEKGKPLSPEKEDSDDGLNVSSQGGGPFQHIIRAAYEREGEKRQFFTDRQLNFIGLFLSGMGLTLGISQTDFKKIFSKPSFMGDEDLSFQEGEKIEKNREENFPDPEELFLNNSHEKTGLKKEWESIIRRDLQSIVNKHKDLF